MGKYTNRMNKYIDRFDDRHFIDNNGCWVWKGTIHSSSGYGQFWEGARTLYAHRWSYELYKDEIPKNLYLDHLCRVHACINPDHLEPVTLKENFRRGDHRSDATHCMHGHEFTPENTYSPPSQPFYRYCRACRRRRSVEQNIRGRQSSLQR